jgi:hypothetical protein
MHQALTYTALVSFKTIRWEHNLPHMKELYDRIERMAGYLTCHTDSIGMKVRNTENDSLLGQFCNLFLPIVHPTLTMAHDGTSQSFALWKGGTKQYMATKN